MDKGEKVLFNIVINCTEVNRTLLTQIAFSSCYSQIGRHGTLSGYQEISLTIPGCMEHHIVVHEMMHAVGFGHEQNRWDRDHYITVHYENIVKNMAYNFEKVRFSVS